MPPSADRHTSCTCCTCYTSKPPCSQPCVCTGLQGFSPSLYEHFVQPNGRKYPYPVVQTFNDSTGRLVDMIVTPQVVEQARRHLGCATLQGAPLEGEGGDGSSGAHWEYRLFQVGGRKLYVVAQPGSSIMCTGRQC